MTNERDKGTPEGGERILRVPLLYVAVFLLGKNLFYFLPLSLVRAFWQRHAIQVTIINPLLHLLEINLKLH